MIVVYAGCIGQHRETACTPNRKRHMVSNSYGYTDPVPLNCHLTSLAIASLCSLRLDISPAKSGSCRLPWLRQCQIGFSITRWLRRRRYATLPYCSVVLRYCFPRYSISKLIFATLVATLHTSSPTSAYATPPPRLASLGVSLAGLSPAHLRGIRRAPDVRSKLHCCIRLLASLIVDLFATDCLEQSSARS
jgi:hypothetical protein